MLREHLSQAHNAASRRLPIVDQQVSWIHEKLLAGTPSRILDLGCGPGLYVVRLAAQGHTVTGIDYSRRLSPTREKSSRAAANLPLGDAYSRRGAIRVDLGDLEGAQDDLRKAILLEPDPYYPKATIAIAMLRARRISEAVQILEPMRNTRPGLAVLAYLAEAYRLERRVDDEAKVCKEILKLALNGEPGHEPACLIGHKALALIRLQRLEEAQNVLAIALEKHPGDVHILVALADLQNATGDSDGLFATLTSLITRLPAGVAVELMHPDFTANLHEVRFRRLLAWALGAQRAACERLRSAHAEKLWPAQG